ncbi:MAG: hypothetical protein AAF298_25160 [Cyanobacteria bacterium P01_A01_bin.40]
MKGEKHNLPKRLVTGGARKSFPAEISNLGKKGGKIRTNIKEIHWTPTKLSVVSFAILAPISFTIVLCFKAGNVMVGSVLLGLIIFMGLIYLALRYIEQNEF